MAKPLNFTKVKKTYLPVTFSDEKETTILVGTPTKAIMDDLRLFEDKLAETEESEQDVDGLYESCAKIMSRNKAGKEITKEFLERVFDFEDIVLFFNSYKELIAEVLSSKN